MGTDRMKEGIKIKKVAVWQALTFVLAALLVASIFTSGFHSWPGAAGTKEAKKASGSIVILNDQRCAECNTAALEQSLSQLFPDYEIKNIDYGTKEGKQLYEGESLKFLPAILMPKSIKSDEGYSDIQQYIAEGKGYLNVMIRAEFDPTAEICNNNIDDTGDGLVDCDDPTCKGNLACRQEMPKRLDIFVMSQCPFGTRALDSMKEVFDAFKGDIDFKVWYIANENPDGTFSSLHGPGEVDENIRELCAAKYYPAKYMEYVWCRNKDIKSAEWKACADSNGMDSAVIENCWKGDEGKQLHSENIKVANELKIGSSPTWLANNRVEFSGIDAESIKQSFCKANPGLAGCEKSLTADSTVQGNC